MISDFITLNIYQLSEQLPFYTRITTFGIFAKQYKYIRLKSVNKNFLENIGTKNLLMIFYFFIFDIYLYPLVDIKT